MHAKIAEKVFDFFPDSKFRQWALLELPRQVMLSFPPDGPTLSFKELMPADFGILKRINPNIDTSCLTERHAAGNRCFLSELDSAPVFYQWVLMNEGAQLISLNTSTDMHVDLILSPGWAYCWDVWTLESQRGRGIQPRATGHLWQYLLKKGCRGLVTLINVNNRSSLRAFSKNGFVKRTTLMHMRCFGVDLILSRYVQGNGGISEQ